MMLKASSLTKLFMSVLCTLLLSACQSTPQVKTYTDAHKKSGFLSDYTTLKLVEGEDGEQVLRWISPNLAKEKFKKLMLDSVVLKPSDIKSDKISTESLEKIQTYFDDKLRKSLSAKYQLTNTPSHDTAHIKIAITDIQLDSEGMRVSEILPYSAAIGLIRAATDTRNKEVTVVLEMEISDSKTNEPMVSLLRVGKGENIRMLWDANFKLQHVEDLLNDWAALASNHFQKLLD